jgi:GNAT superfamily N-acetyltransferase
MNTSTALYRESVRHSDLDAVRDIVRSTGYFSEEEIDVACELVSERLLRGEKSGYHFLFVESSGQVTAYSCFGRIPGTACSYDLYWIVVRNDFRSQGIGKKLLKKTENRVVGMGGCRIYIETSSRILYESTRQFYLRCGYITAAILEDFYAPSDDKIIYMKTLRRQSQITELPVRPAQRGKPAL